MACKATMKCQDVLDNHQKKIEDIETAALLATDDNPYPVEAQKQDHRVAMVQTGFDFVKLYAPAAGLGLLSVGLILGGHGILRKRNLALVGAYKALEEGYLAYRARNIEDQGIEKDRMYMQGLHEEEKISEEVDPKTGKKKKVKTMQAVPGRKKGSPYGRYYTQGCKQWRGQHDYNLMFCKQTEDYWNMIYKTFGEVWLYEIYDAFGWEKTKACLRVGWKKDRGPNGKFVTRPGCDDTISFGLSNSDEDKYANAAFYDGTTNDIWMDFNVDGNIDVLLTKDI